MEKLYQATSRYACAGFVTKNDYVCITAPILRKNISSKHITTAMTILTKLGYKVIEVERKTNDTVLGSTCSNNCGISIFNF